MARAALYRYVLVLSFLLALRSGNADESEIEVAPETQYTPQGKEAEFFCRGVGITVHWVTNNQLITNQNEKKYENQGFHFDTNREVLDDDYSVFSLTVWVPGTVANNNSKIQCLTMGHTTLESAPAYVIVLGRPSAVDPSLHYISEIVLSVDWSPPFTWEGYAVTEYEVKVRNTTVDQITHYEELKPDDGTSNLTLMLTAPMGQAAHSCHKLEVTITVKTPLGSSDPATLPVWFPIAPAPFSSPPIVEVLFSKLTSSVIVKVSFVLPELCPSQLIDYSIVVRESATQDVVAWIVHEDYHVSEGSNIQEEFTQETFTDLAMGKDYEATVSTTGVTGGQSAVSKFQPTTEGVSGDKDDEDNGLVIIVGVASGGAVLIGLLVIITVATFIVRKRTMRPIEQNGDRRLMTNPIYEGPLYETVSDAKLSPASTLGEMPTVVRESPYFGSQIHPTYENGNMKWPPDINVPSLPASSYDDSYTMMSTATPAVKKLTDEERPKPDVNRYVETD